MAWRKALKLPQWERRKGTTLSEFAHARNTDPETSHEAAASVKGLGAARDAVLWMFKRHGNLCDTELIYYYKSYVGSRRVPVQSDSGIRSRRAELVKSGHLIATHQYATLKTGRRSVIWGYTE